MLNLLKNKQTKQTEKTELQKQKFANFRGLCAGLFLVSCNQWRLQEVTVLGNSLAQKSSVKC